MRGCQIWRARSIRLLLVACDGFIEDLTAGFSPVHALASDLGLTPMTLDLLICISSVPIAGIATIEAASTRQFFLGDRELVRFARLDDELPPVAFPDRARNCTAEVPMTEPVFDDLNEAFERLTKLRSAGLSGACPEGFFMHCGAAPSYS